MTRTSQDPVAVFSRFGLRPDSLIRVALPQKETLAVRLRQALEELGGVYLAFGVYLQWRSDLLTSGQIEALSPLVLDLPGISRQQVAELLMSKLPDKGGAIAPTLADTPEWVTLNRTGFRARVEDQFVIVQVPHPPVPDAEIVAFRRGILALGAPELAHVARPEILRQFEEWLRTAETAGSERDFLDAIGNYGLNIGTVYPLPVAYLCTEDFLIWPLIEGETAAALVAKGDPEICSSVAGAILEQFCVLAIVECDLRLDAMVVTAEGKLAFRRLSRATATPPGLTAAALEYVAAAIARNAALSTRALLRLAISYESPVLERELVSKLSAVDPELKVHRWFPPSVETFEANWRAVSRLDVPRSLFLDCLHRNLVAIGYWIGDSIRAGAPPKDAIADAQWPVVGRMLRSRMAALISPDTALEWAASGGLLALGVMKEASRIAAEVRDNRLSMGFDITRRQDRTETTRPTWLLPFGLLLLSIFLICLRWGNMAPPILILPVRALTIATFLGLFWVVLRIR